MTASFAAALLSEKFWLARAHRDVREMWEWHLIEEIEHKAVALDVFRAAGGSERVRRMALAFALAFFLKDLYTITKLALRARKLWGLRARVKVARLLVGRRGLLWRAGSRLAAFFRSDFHPWQHDDAPLLGGFQYSIDDLDDVGAQWRGPA